MSEQVASPAIEQARADVIAALLCAGEQIMANLDGATETGHAEASRLLGEAKFRGIVLNELLIEENGDV